MVGTVAFVCAIIGFIFACIPGALIVGWVLLPIAFVLAIVALFMRGQGKKLAIAGLIIAVTGTVIGFIVFFAVVATSFNSAFNGTASSVTSATSSPQASNEGANKSAAAPASGTRTNPAAIGATIRGTEYDVTINSVALNATDKVLAANEFNEKPKSGYMFAVVNVTIQYTGSDTGTAAEASVDYVTKDGNVISNLDTVAVAPDPALDMSSEMYKGAKVTGNIALAIPESADGLLRVEPGTLAHGVFVSLH